MNNVRSIQAINKREIESGVSTSASWHADYRDTAFIYVGGLPYELSEGDIITIFSQFGEPVFINLVRDKETGKSKGFAFLKYEDQRSTDLAVDNLGGTTLMGRTLRVDHTRYKRKEGEDLGDNTIPEDIAESSDGDAGKSTRKHSRRHDIENEEDERPLLKEEKELAELLRNHDADDPMKEYLVQEKREEVNAAIARYNAESKRHQKSHKHRHHRSHRSHRHDRERNKTHDRDRKHN